LSADRRPAYVAGIALAVLLLDQAVKVFIKLSFSLTERVAWIPGAFDIQFIENDGMAFGWALPGATGKYLLTAFRIVAVVLLSVHVARVAKQGAPRGFRQALALILAGAAGNIVDSVCYGKLFSRSSFGQSANWSWHSEWGSYAPWFRGNVVDMLHITVRWPEWWPVDAWSGQEVFPPIFNIADAAITCGVAWIVLRQKSWLGSNAGWAQTAESEASDVHEEPLERAPDVSVSDR
jgi:signal peptidase II